MRKGRLIGENLSYKVVLVVAAVVIVAGIGAVVAADNGKTISNRLLLRQPTLFNPFTLQTTRILATASGSTANNDDFGLFVALGSSGRPPIRIPFRPPLRSPFRPPLP